MEFFKQHKDKFIIGGIALFIINVVVILSFKVLIPSIKEEIKKELRQPYGPSPFGPSVNQDSVVKRDKALQLPTYGSSQYETQQFGERVQPQNYGSWVGNWELSRKN